jgi:hypothetical protein
MMKKIPSSIGNIPIQVGEGIMLATDSQIVQEEKFFVWYLQLFCKSEIVKNKKKKSRQAW